MKTIGFTMIALGLALAAVPASAQGQTSYTLISATGNVWNVEGVSGTNPTLEVPASTEITVTARNEDGGVHNLKIGDGETMDLFAEGDEIVYTFTSPASGTVEYICTIHAATMKGDFRVAGADGGNGGNGENGGGNDSPGLGLVGALVALLGLALVLRRK